MLYISFYIIVSFPLHLNYEALIWVYINEMGSQVLMDLKPDGKMNVLFAGKTIKLVEKQKKFRSEKDEN